MQDPVILERLQGQLGYRFRDPDLLQQALTHKSYANEQPAGSFDHNERLEFLGDAVLGLAVSEQVFNGFPGLPEGEMTRIRAEVVSEGSLARIGRTLELGAALQLGRGEARSGGREKDSLVADACEALLGALFCDGGFDAVREAVERLFAPAVAESARRKSGVDYKTRLQELLQARHGRPPTYRPAGVAGPDHQRIYHVDVCCGEDRLGSGSGRSKKAAEQQAAREALTRLGC